MPDRFSKDLILRVLEDLPDDVTLAGAIENLVYLRKIEIARGQMAEGKTIALEQIGFPRDADSRTPATREAIVAALYGQERLSGRDARTLLGISRREFEEMLGRHGVSVFIDTDENVRIELDQGDG
jgi:hypothetical protein